MDPGLDNDMICGVEMSPQKAFPIVLSVSPAKDALEVGYLEISKDFTQWNVKVLP